MVDVIQIAEGDSFDEIAEVGTRGSDITQADFLAAILTANPNIDPEQLEPGSMLVLPVGKATGNRGALAPPAAFEPELLERQLKEFVGYLNRRQTAASQDNADQYVQVLVENPDLEWFTDALKNLVEQLAQSVALAQEDVNAVETAIASWLQQIQDRAKNHD